MPCLSLAVVFMYVLSIILLGVIHHYDRNLWCMKMYMMSFAIKLL